MAEDVAARVYAEWEGLSESFKMQMKSRGVRAANELRNASQLVLRGQRHGRRYIVPGTGSVRYYKRDSNPIGLVYHKRNSKNHKAGTASLIYRDKAGTARITYRYYTASAPGEPPAVRTGVFRMSWQPRSYAVRQGDAYEVRAQTVSDAKTDRGNYNLSELLDGGTKDGRIAPRPHQERIVNKALPAIKKIYNEPYV